MTDEAPGIVIVDSGAGNLRSIQKAVEKLGGIARISNNPADLATAVGIILPGVGAFSSAMDVLNRTGMTDAIGMFARLDKKPVLGICLGMQLLARKSQEGGDIKGLGLVEADVIKIDFPEARNWAGKKLRLPHMGWNSVNPMPRSRLFDGVGPGSDYYFVHNYHVVCDQSEDVAAVVDYGRNIVCALETGNIFATQFHPEKSQKNGTKIIANFLRICGYNQ